MGDYYWERGSLPPPLAATSTLALVCCLKKITTGFEECKIQERGGVTGLAEGIKKAQDYLLSIQKKPDGHWVAEAGVETLPSQPEDYLTPTVFGISEKLPWRKSKRICRSKTRDLGGGCYFYGGGASQRLGGSLMSLRLGSVLRTRLCKGK